MATAPDFLVDTNVFVYAFDGADPERRDRAREIIVRLNESRRGCITTQVVGEWLSVALRKESLGVSRDQACEAARRLLRSWQVFGVTPDVSWYAIAGVLQHWLGIYDAQIWATAVLNAIPVLLTEDGPTGQTIDGVAFVNPFRRDFDLEQLGPAPA